MKHSIINGTINAVRHARLVIVFKKKLLVSVSFLRYGVASLWGSGWRTSSGLMS